MQYLLNTDLLMRALQKKSGLEAEVLERCRKKELKGWVLSSSIPALYEDLRQNGGDRAARTELKRLLEGIAILSQTAADIQESLDSSGLDFGPAMTVKAVRALGLDGVATAAPETFKGADIKARTAGEVLEILQAGDKSDDRVPLLDIPASYHEVLFDMEREMAEVLRSGHFILGPHVARLEEKIAQYCQCRYAVGVSSGTDALLISLMAANVGPGDEVIATPFTFYATAGSIVRVGARPVFVDIDPATYNLNPDQVESKVSKKTKAVIPVHLYGQCADMDPLLETARKHGLAVIEDAAQAIGASYQGRRAGSLGDYGCFSFFPTKNLGGLGDAGMVTVSSEEIYQKLVILRTHGAKPKYYHKVVGGNFRLDTLQAAAIYAKLNYLESWTEKRRQNAFRYDRLLSEAGLQEHVQAPRELVPRHVYNQYVVRVKNRRDDLKKFLQEKKVQTEIYYPLPLHLQECFASLGYRQGDFPESEKAALETLALPIYPELTPERQEYTVRVIKEFLA